MNLDQNHVAEEIAVNREWGGVYNHTDSLAGKDSGEALWPKGVTEVFAPFVNDAAMGWEAPL